MREAGRADGGWILLSDRIVDSAVFHGPPDLFRLWVLLLCAAHRGVKPFRSLGGVELRRGELLTSRGRLQKQLERDGNPQLGEPAKVTPSRATVGRWLDVLRDEGMITLERSGRRGGTLVHVVNFDRYQDFSFYCPNLRPGSVSTNSGTERRNGAANSVQSELPVKQEDSEDDLLASGQSSGRKRTTSGSPYTSGSPDPSIRDRREVPPAQGQGTPASLPPLDFDYESGKWNRKPTADEVSRWRKAFPAVDLRSELEKATLYLIDLPKNKRKKKHGAFLRNWFSRAQDWKDRRG